VPSATNELEETEQKSGERDYGDQEEDDAMRTAHDFLADPYRKSGRYMC